MSTAENPLPLLDQQVVESIKSVGTSDDDFASQLYKMFVDQSAAVIDEMMVAVTDRNVVATKRLAHRLKGSAANVGARAMSRQAALIESTITNEKADEVFLNSAAQELSALFGQTRSQLSSMSLIS